MSLRSSVSPDHTGQPLNPYTACNSHHYSILLLDHGPLLLMASGTKKKRHRTGAEVRKSH